MTTDEKWKQFKETARQKLNFTYQPSFIESFIEYTCEPSFAPIFNLQLIWTEKYVKWRKAEWDIHADWNLFYEQDGVAKVVLSNLEPIVNIISGNTTHEFLEDIIDHIRKLKVQPRIDRLKMFTLDGNMNTFSLGVGDLRTTYHWHTLPEEWSDLAQLVDRILDLGKQLK